MGDVASDVVTDVASESGVTARRLGCTRCQTEFAQVLFGAHWSPVSCPVCHPPQRLQVSEPAPPAPERRRERRYKGNILEDLRAAGVNVRKYGHATMEALSDKSDPWSLINHDPQALERAWEWLAGWKEKRSRSYASIDWMYFYGANSSYSDKAPRDRQVTIGALGNLKTTCHIAMARHLIEEGELDPGKYRFVTAEDLLLETEATFRGDDESELRLLRRYEALDLLHVDDLGVRSDPKPHAIRVFDGIAKRREAHGMFWGSNLSIPVLLQAMPAMERTVDRITGECGHGSRYIVKFSGPSRRQARSQGRV